MSGSLAEVTVPLARATGEDFGVSPVVSPLEQKIVDANQRSCACYENGCSRFNVLVLIIFLVLVDATLLGTTIYYGVYNPCTPS
jgi:hypothetical protein